MIVSFLGYYSTLLYIASLKFLIFCNGYNFYNCLGVAGEADYIEDHGGNSQVSISITVEAEKAWFCSTHWACLHMRTRALTHTQLISLNLTRLHMIIA
jgi:hypothetical protein